MLIYFRKTKRFDPRGVPNNVRHREEFMNLKLTDGKQNLDEWISYSVRNKRNQVESKESYYFWHRLNNSFTAVSLPHFSYTTSNYEFT